MKHKGLIFGCLLINFISLKINAQKSDWLIRSGYQGSRLVVHTPKFKVNPKGIANTFEVSLSKKVSGNKYWHHRLKFPKYGFLIKFIDLGQPSAVLGDALGAIGYYDFTLKSRMKSRSYFFIGTGISYNTKVYHFKNNPLQTAISTPLNNLTSFEYRYEWKCTQHWNYYTGLSLNHLSNGSFKSPNLGLNYIGIILGLSQYESKARQDYQDSIPKIKKWSIGLNYGIAYIEDKLYNGPKYRIQNINLQFSYEYALYRIINCGFDIEQHDLSAYFAYRTELTADVKSAYNLSLRLHVFAGHEWLIGSTSIEARMGYQVRKGGVITGIPLYTKLIFNYNIPIRFISGLSMDAGITLKAHYGNAEYISLNLGLTQNLF